MVAAGVHAELPRAHRAVTPPAEWKRRHGGAAADQRTTPPSAPGVPASDERAAAAARGRTADERRPVILLHGIRTDGKWQGPAARLLKPFFTPHEVKYPHYRHLGAVKLALDPTALAVVVLVVALTLGALAHWAPGALGWRAGVAAAVTLAAGAVWAHRRAAGHLVAARKFVLERVAPIARGIRPHVVAHSLGTFLTASALLEYPGLRLGRLVFCGCVLSRRFPWAPLLTPKASRVDAVRNETGLKDPVPRLAAYLARRFPRLVPADLVVPPPPGAAGRARRPVTVPAFGDAGVVGFDGPPQYVHAQHDPNAPCPRCARPKVRERGWGGRVHNVRLPFDHNSGFDGGVQCDAYWLPFLLGYEPTAWAQWTEIYEPLLESERRSDGLLAALELDFRLRPWPWGGDVESVLRRRVSDEFAERFRFAPPPETVDELVGLATGLLWRLVLDAKRERAKPEGGDENVIRALDPHTAAERAARAAVEHHQPRRNP